jgi:hypothetical protein
MKLSSLRSLAAGVLALGAVISIQAADSTDMSAPVKLTPPRVRLSPHETISFGPNPGKVIIVYGRPYTNAPKTGKVRTVWGGELVPAGTIWRLGSDEATLLITPTALTFGTDNAVTVPAGTYTMYLYPDSADKVSLVINRQVGQWGTVYNKDQDLARIPMSEAKLSEPIHQFQMALDKGKGGGVLKLMWEDTQFSVPFTVAK